MLQTPISSSLFSLEMQIKVSHAITDFVGDFVTDRPESILIRNQHSPIIGAYRPGTTVPIVLTANGRSCFDFGDWGFSKSGEQLEYFRKCVGQSLGYPALIPASSIELSLPNRTLRVTSACEERLYVGATYFQVGTGARISVVPLYVDAGPDLSPFTRWQPLLIPIHSIPRSGILDFISEQGAAHLRRPSARNSLAVAVC